MLDHEPTGTVDQDAAATTPDTTTTAAAAPRRRRAAGRPAGPPVAPPEGAAAAEPAAAEATPDAAAEAAPKAKRTRKKAATKPPAPEPKTPADQDDEAAEAAPKAKRTRKKKSEPVPPEPADAALAETDAEAAAATEAEDGGGAAAATPPPATTLLFQAPSADAPPRRRRAAGRPAGEPVPAERSEQPAEKAPAEASERGASERGASEQETSEDVAPRRRSRRRSIADENELAEPGYADGQPLDEGATDEQGAEDDEDDEPGTGRRRRRRGGRGRRGRGSRAGEGEPGDETESGAEGATGPTEASDGGVADAADEDGGEAGTRRRRRRRRRGEDGEESPDDPDNTVTRVRATRAPRAERARDEVTSVRGSTRLEAKKQRRREGREAGRRRAPILTEAEFLSRREAVERVMVVREGAERTQIAVLEDGVLVEHYVNKRESTSLMGDVFLGRVQNVLPSMEAAFVDIGKGRNAVLYAGEVNFEGLEGQPKRIEHALKSGQSVLVQVTKDPIGHKGSRLTSQISLPGRYLVYVPEGSMTGISRKLPDTERSRLKAILKKVVPEDAGVIIRTAAEGASEEELARDVERLAKQWEKIQKKAKTASAPALLHGEPDLTIRVVRDIFNSDFGSLVVAGDTAWDEISDYVSHAAPDLAERVSRWTGTEDVFAAHRVDEQILKALDRKVWLPSGGSLVIDRTEAMTVVDVNTGKFTGQGGNLEETVTRNNLEAAEEMVRQLRLRDIGGIIVIDFIDMVLENNRELVLRRLVECLGRDRTKHQVAEVTSLGLVQMTRKRVGQGLLEAFSHSCEHCNGRGIVVRTDQPGKPAAVPKPAPPGPRPPADGENAADRPGRRRRRGKGGGGDPAEVEAVPDEAVALEAESGADAGIGAEPALTAADVATDEASSPNGAVTASSDDPDASGAPEAAPKRTRRRKAAAPADVESASV